jgi:hydroxypyruvate isomerase
MKGTDMNHGTTRREFWTAAASIAAVAVAASGAEVAGAADPLPPPRYTLSPNLELLFPAEVKYVDRLRAVGNAGAKAYSFWGPEKQPLKEFRSIADGFGMRCTSMSGPMKTGWKTGLTRPGAQQAYFDDLLACIETAKVVGCSNLITFVGETQRDLPPKQQHAQIVEGLKKAGDIAAKGGVYLCLEALNRVESPQMSVLTAAYALEIIAEVDHPHVRMDFDMYHLQLSEGNLSNNLKLGLEKKLIRYVEVGDVPGRFEPGTGEINYQHMFDLLRRLGYAGDIGMEHRAKTTFAEAFAATKRLAGVA